MKKTLLQTIVVFLFLALLPTIYAVPQLPTEFYGVIYTSGTPATTGTITVEVVNGSQCGSSFTIQNEGYFGLITCPTLSDYDTDGLTQGTEIAIYYNDERTAVLSGDNITQPGGFNFLNVSHPMPVCGDNYCDPFFEDHLTCPQDCEDPDAPPGNGTGDDNISAPPETTPPDDSSPDAGGGEGGAGGGSGGGAGDGGGESAGDFSDALDFFDGFSGVGVPGVTCTEEWVCGEWEECQIDGVQERECVDRNNCGTQASIPELARECEYAVDEEEIPPEEEQPAPTEPSRPSISFPPLICEKSINPLTNAGIIFFIITIVLILTRSFFYIKKIRTLHKGDSKLDDYVRAKQYFAERRKFLLFIIITVTITLLAYLFYYEFILCDLDYDYLWWFILLLIIVPFLIYELWHFIEYNDKKKLYALGMLSQEHERAMTRMLEQETQQILEIEQEIKRLVDSMALNTQLREKLESFPELRTIYKDIMRLYYEYQNNKSPYGIEKELCEQVYAIETNEHFKELAQQHTDFSKLYERLRVLYSHYEAKQELYEKLDGERERLQKKLAETKQPPKELSEDTGGDSSSDNSGSSSTTEGSGDGEQKTN